MRAKEKVLQQLVDSGVVAVIRAPSTDVLLPLARALVEGGVLGIEVTMSTPKAIAGIERLADELGDDAIVGVGTVLDAATASDAMRAGARFVVSPFTDERVIETTVRHGQVMIPGAFTPTEIMRAWSLGGDIIKVFPSTSLGPQYIKDLLAPMPQLRLTPTGSVDAANAGEWIKAGAVCVGVGSALVSKKALADGDWTAITAAARSLVGSVKAARQKMID